jgi:hypothetical protein
MPPDYCIPQLGEQCADRLDFQCAESLVCESGFCVEPSPAPNCPAPEIEDEFGNCILPGTAPELFDATVSTSFEGDDLGNHVVIEVSGQDIDGDVAGVYVEFISPGAVCTFTAEDIWIFFIPPVTTTAQFTESVDGYVSGSVYADRAIVQLFDSNGHLSNELCVPLTVF